MKATRSKESESLVPSVFSRHRRSPICCRSCAVARRYTISDAGYMFECAGISARLASLSLSRLVCQTNEFQSRRYFQFTISRFYVRIELLLHQHFTGRDCLVPFVPLVALPSFLSVKEPRDT